MVKNKMTVPHLTLLPTIKSNDGNVVIYHEPHIIKYLNEEVPSNLMSMTEDEKEKFFEFLFKYKELFKKIFSVDIMNRFLGPAIYIDESVEKIKNGISDEELANNPMLTQYMEWLNKKT